LVSAEILFPQGPAKADGKAQDFHIALSRHPVMTEFVKGDQYPQGKDKGQQMLQKTDHATRSRTVAWANSRAALSSARMTSREVAA